MEVIKSYKIPFSEIRTLTKIKKELLEDFMLLNKRLHNYISKENYSGINYWNDIKKEDSDLVRQYYEQNFQNDEFLKSAYAQNIFKRANESYKKTIAGFFSKSSKKTKSKKKFFKKPYFENPLRFQLDYRMMGKDFLIKDKEIDNLFWFKFSNPFNKDYKNNSESYHNSGKFIKIPLYGYDRVLKLLNQISTGTNNFTYSFALGEDLKSIILNTSQNIEEIEIIKDCHFNKSKKNLKQITKNIEAIDFGKNIGLASGKTMSYKNFYNKVLRLQKELAELQSLISLKKNAKIFDEDYKDLKQKSSKLFKKISEIRKHTYFHLANKVIKNKEIIIAEDLTLITKVKKSKDYKGKGFNKMITTMGSRKWLEILRYKTSMLGKQLVLVNSKNTSRRCFKCGNVDKKSRNGKIFKCTGCGHKVDADFNASLNILELGLMKIGQCGFKDNTLISY